MHLSVFFLAVLLFAAQSPLAADPKKDPVIPLELDGLINLSGTRPAVELIDESELAGDPLGGKGGQPDTVFSHGWEGKDLYFPLDVVVDLKATHQISGLCYYDANGAGPLTVASGSPKEWTNLLSDDLKSYRQWKNHRIDEKTRFLRFRFETPGALISEIVLYGQPIREAEAPPVRNSPKPERVTMDRFLGINGFVDDPIERLEAAGALREYHQWAWDEGNTDRSYPGFPRNQYAWSPSWVSGPGWGWDFDQFYSALHKAGIEIMPVLQQTAPYLVNYEMERISEKPVSSGEDSEKAESYREHADWMFQFAARYGSRKVPDELLKLRPGQPVRSGLGLIRYLENCNEPDRWWHGRKGFFRPFELAAMSSADYDGDQKRLGATVGVKNADPDMKFVMGGLASPEPEYLKAMLLWAQVFRGGDFPADVINVHHYSNDAGGQLDGASQGISPEADDLKGRMRALVAFRDRHLPGKELWITEFGYDTNPGSRQHAPPIADFDAEEVQAQWIVRSYLELAAAGVDRAFQYMLRDVNAANPVHYNSSGLTREKWNQHQPKKSWFYVATMKHVLRGFTFEREITEGLPDDLRVSSFRSTDGTQKVLAVWSATSEGRTVPGFRLPVGQIRSAEKVELIGDSTSGNRTELDVVDGAVLIDVSERPVFVVGQID